METFYVAKVSVDIFRRLCSYFLLTVVNMKIIVGFRFYYLYPG
jgi:hypothetical protein